jgi:hypothetical protein
LGTTYHTYLHNTNLPVEPSIPMLTCGYLEKTEKSSCLPRKLVQHVSRQVSTLRHPQNIVLRHPQNIVASKTTTGSTPEHCLCNNFSSRSQKSLDCALSAIGRRMPLSTSHNRSRPAPARHVGLSRFVSAWPCPVKPFSSLKKKKKGPVLAAMGSFCFQECKSQSSPRVNHSCHPFRELH